MLQPIDERGKLRPKFVVAYLAFTSFWFVLAAAQTAYFGSAAWPSWALAGFFIFIFVMIFVARALARRDSVKIR